MLVHSLWDQEDIYGAIAVYKAIEPKDTGNDKVFLVMGPWHDIETRSRTNRRTSMDWDADHILLRTVKCVSGTVEL